MPSQIIVVLFLTFITNLIATLAHGVRIVAVRTGRIAFLSRCSIYSSL